MPDPILLISLFGGLLLMALAGDLLVRERAYFYALKFLGRLTGKLED